MLKTPARKISNLSLGFGSPIPSKTSLQMRPIRSNLSSPVGLKFLSTTDCFQKFASPTNKIKKELAEAIQELSTKGNYITKARSAFKALEICANEEGIYQREMKIIVSAVREAIFQEKEKVNTEILSKIYESHTEAILDSKLVPYFYIAESVAEIMESLRKENLAQKAELSLGKHDLKIKLNQKKAEILSLKTYIDANLTEPLKQKDVYIKSLEEKLQNSGKTISKLNEAIFENEDQLKQIKSQAMFHKRCIVELKNNEEAKDQKIAELIKELEELKNRLKASEEENGNLKCSLRNSIYKLRQASDREKYLEKRNSDIELKNHALAVRAAEGFQNLTPRPSFIGIEELLPEVPKTTKDKASKILSLALIKSKSEIEPNRKRNGILVSQKKNTMRPTNTRSPVMVSPVNSWVEAEQT